MRNKYALTTGHNGDMFFITILNYNKSEPDSHFKIVKVFFNRHKAEETIDIMNYEREYKNEAD